MTFLMISPVTTMPTIAAAASTLSRSGLRVIALRSAVARTDGFGGEGTM